MRIGELGRRSGVPIATIKYYVREGLLPPGERTQANQVSYHQDHLRRLGLIRALMEVGGLSVRAAHSVTSRLDENPEMTLFSAMGKAQYALIDPEFDHPGRPATTTQAHDEATVDELINRYGWSIGPHNPARATLADTLAVARRLGLADLADHIDRYAHIAAELADLDVELMLRRDNRDEAAERMVLLTIIGDRLLSALRRLAQEDAAARRLHPPHRTPPPSRRTSAPTNPGDSPTP